MDKDFQKLFNTLETLEPKKGAVSAVLFRIQHHKRRIARIKFTLLGLSSALSAAAIFPVISYTVSGFVSTGFYQYISLAFSDGGAILPYWKEFIMTLAESLPAFEISLLLAVIFALLESLKLTIKNMPVAFYKFN
ncbi:MAG: hypothetical protein WCT49_05040 [Candidatus Paceibacterota bacterium]|jgi:hypothetical protein|nr:hypothetical protein [Candidatus Paceibacterota bacterium]